MPFTDLHENLSHSPFVMPNSYGFNEAKFIDGQNMNDWQTGSSNVLLKILVRYVFGFEPAVDGAWIQPAAWSPLKAFEFSTRFRDCDVNIAFEAAGRKSRSFMVDGEPKLGSFDENMGVTRLWLGDEAFGGSSIEIRVME